MVASNALRHRSILAAMALTVLAGRAAPGPAEAQVPSPTETNIVAGPAGATPAGIVTGYVNKVVPSPQGWQATFHNADLTGAHNVYSVDEHPDGRPLFWSPTIGFAQTTTINGVEDLEPGVYEFYCTPHSGTMRGFLVVTAGVDGEGIPEPPDELPGIDDLPELPLEPDPGEPGEPSDDSWPLFGRDLSNSRHTESGPAAEDLLGYGEAWRYETGGSGDFAGTPVVVGERVFMASSAGRAVALDAGTGEPIWEVDLATSEFSAKVTASVAYHDGVVYVPVSGQRPGASAAARYAAHVVALRASDGLELWRTLVDDEQPLGDLYGSPVVWETTVEGENGEERFAALYIGTSSWDSGGSGAPELHLGTVVALDLTNGGELLWRTYMVEGGPHTKDEVGVYEGSGKLYDGAAVWSTPAVDIETGELFVGTGNGYESTHSLVASLVKLDAFTGELLDSYQATETDAWQLTAPNRGVDADFGASPQLVEGPAGERWLGAGQKNMHVVEELTGSNQANTMVGLTRYHMINRETMEPEWVTAVGPGYWWGGITGATAYDGERIYGSTVYGQMFALEAETGTPVWMVPAGDAATHMAHTQVANGIVYSADGKGFVSAWDAATGVPVWSRPMVGPNTVGPSAAGVSVVGDTVYTALGFDAVPGGIYAFRAQ